jgi:hypothetical protein
MYTREELDHIEAEWAYQQYGRAALMEVETCRVLLICGERDIPVSRVIEALQPKSKERKALRVVTPANILRMLL